MNLLKKLAAGLVLVVTMMLLSGCETTNSYNWSGDTNVAVPAANPVSDLGLAFNVGDLVIVNFAGVEQAPPPHEERVKEDGTITLPLVGAIVAKGKSPGELQKEIRAQYVPKYFTESLNVTVKGMDRFFFVGGEVKSPSRYPWTEGMTVVKAIQTAGYFTDYAKTSKVRVTRLNGKSIILNYDKALENPERDVPVYPGDTINVPRRVW